MFSLPFLHPYLVSYSSSFLCVFEMASLIAQIGLNCLRQAGLDLELVTVFLPVNSEEASVAMTAILHKYELIPCILMSLGLRRKETFLYKHF